MNRAERRAEESATRRALAIIHGRLLPGGCLRCGGAARLRWFSGLGDAGDVLGWDAVNVLIEPQEIQVALADDDHIDIWACDCGGAGAVSW